MRMKGSNVFIHALLLLAVISFVFYVVVINLYLGSCVNAAIGEETVSRLLRGNEEDLRKESVTVYSRSGKSKPSGNGSSSSTEKKTKVTRKIAIDAGHQEKGDSSTEPAGPGSSVKKAKVAGGATGIASGVPEYKLTLSVAKKLKKELTDRGYKVYMVRTKNAVNISNKKRAEKANSSGADVCVRIHADSSDSSSVVGASVLYPSKLNPYVSKLSKKSYALSKAILDAYCKATGVKNRGLFERDDLTGTNWSKIPVALIEMGFLSNSTEDRNMQKNAFQKKMAKGMADGIDAYFK